MTTKNLSCFIAKCLLALIVGSVSADDDPPVEPFTDDWPQWRGQRASGVWNFGASAIDLRKESVGLVWERPIGPAFSGISVHGGKVFTMDRPRTPADLERVVCLDGSSGATVWEHAYPTKYGDLDYGKGPRATPTISDGRVYTLGSVGHVLCLDELTGKVIWSHDLAAEKAQLPTWGFAASPVIYRDLVIIHAAVQPGGCLTAYDRFSGKEAWRSGIDPAGYCTPILVRHAEQDLLVCWTPEHVVGVRPNDGQELWKIPYKVTYGVSIATPIFSNGIILVAGYWEGTKAIKLGEDVSQASVLWEENRFLRGLMSQPLYREGFAYLLDKQHGLVCFTLETGEIQWTDDNRLTPRGRNPQANLVWLGSGPEAVALNSDGELVLLRLTPKGYEELARLKVIGETWAHPAFAGPFVFVRDDERLICLRVAPKPGKSP